MSSQAPILTLMRPRAAHGHGPRWGPPRRQDRDADQVIGPGYVMTTRGQAYMFWRSDMMISRLLTGQLTVSLYAGVRVRVCDPMGGRVGVHVCVRVRVPALGSLG